jgi:hypothetical protein
MTRQVCTTRWARLVLPAHVGEVLSPDPVLLGLTAGSPGAPYDRRQLKRRSGCSSIALGATPSWPWS